MVSSYNVVCTCLLSSNQVDCPVQPSSLRSAKPVTLTWVPEKLNLRWSSTWNEQEFITYLGSSNLSVIVVKTCNGCSTAHSHVWEACLRYIKRSRFRVWGLTLTWMLQFLGLVHQFHSQHPTPSQAIDTNVSSRHKTSYALSEIIQKEKAYLHSWLQVKMQSQKVLVSLNAFT